MKINQPSTLILFAGLFMACNPDAKKTEDRLPEPKEVYVFPFSSRVDAQQISCGYQFREEQSDELKKWIRKKVKPVSVEKQKNFGRQIHHENLPYPIANRHPKEQMVKRIISRMRPFLTNQDFEYTPYILSSAQFNAFTVPGGNIYLTVGLLDLTQTEDELAYIIGHELGHNENGHTRESARFFEYIDEMDQSIRKEQDGLLRAVRETLGAVTITSLSLMTGYFNQPDELEADLTGVYLAYQAGYDPEKALKGFELLKKFDAPKPHEKYKEHMVTLLRTHPWSEDRYNCAAKYIRQAKTVAACDSIYPFDRTGIVITQKDSLNIREFPNAHAGSLARLASKSQVALICDCVAQPYGRPGKWVYVESEKGVRGWVDGRYLEVVE